MTDTNDGDRKPRSTSKPGPMWCIFIAAMLAIAGLVNVIAGNQLLGSILLFVAAAFWIRLAIARGNGRSGRAEWSFGVPMAPQHDFDHIHRS